MRPAVQTTISLIVAVAKNGVIGRDGDLPWRLSTDLKLFRRLTMGKPVVMGRKTWATLQKKPLDGRDNIVVTRNAAFAAGGAIVVGSIEAAIEKAREAAEVRGADEIMIIGGAEIYRAALPAADRVYLTEVAAEPAGDAHFPQLSGAEWLTVAEQTLDRGLNDDYAAVLRVLERRPAARPALQNRET
ncbi:MAG: dihydrofolate reductase [Hyphomicrobiaceae bacterium]